MSKTLKNRLYPRHRKWSFSLSTLCWIATIVVIGTGFWRLFIENQNARNEIARLSRLVYEDATIPIEYERIRLVRIDGEQYALRLTLEKIDDPSRVLYEWLHFTDAIVEDERIVGDQWPDVFAQFPESLRGDGFVDEQLGKTSISVGPVSIPWSRGGLEAGWLYLSESRFSGEAMVSLEFYQDQFDAISQATYLDPRRWRLVRGAGESTEEY